jgi:hypothetical protein
MWGNTCVRRSEVTKLHQKKARHVPIATPQTEERKRDALCKRPLYDTHKLGSQPPRNAHQLGRIRHFAFRLALLLADTQRLGEPGVPLLDLAFALAGESELRSGTGHGRAEVATGARQRDGGETRLGFGTGGGGVTHLCAGVLCWEAERERDEARGDVSDDAERGARPYYAP